MEGIIHKTSDTLNGLWHFDANALEALDRVINETCERLNGQTEHEKANAVRREQDKTVSRYESYHPESPLTDDKRKELHAEAKQDALRYGKFDAKREILITFASQQKLVVQSFAEAKRHPDAVNQYPKSFNVSCESGKRRFSIGSPAYLSTNSITINASPETDELSRETFTRLVQWAEGLRSPWWMLWWNRLASVQWFVWPVILVLGLQIWGQSAADRGRAARAEGRSLLADGISTAEEHRALELILSILSNYQADAKPVENGVPWRMIMGACILVATMAVISVCPKTTIGIGLGARSLDRQRKWVRAVTFIIPIMVLWTIGSSTIGSALWEWIKATW